jgi:exocyst complex protein 7
MAPARHAAFAEESAEVEVLYANLEKMKSLSRKIQGSMARLDVSGKVVQDAIGPIYGNTQRLQTTTTNVDRITEAIEKARQPLDMRNREEQVLRERPDRVGLSQYIASMDRTNRALKDLKATNMRSNQKAAADLSELLEVGTRNLETVFRDVVRQDSQPIEPLQQIMRGNEFPKFSQKSSAELRTINGQVASFQAQTSNTDLSPTAKVYAQERGQYIQLSLQNLSAASLSTARKVNADAVYKPGSNGIATYCSGIQGMFTAEYACICEVFQREEWNPVLTATCQSALSAFGNTLRDLDNHIRTNLLTDCYLAYEIVDLVSNTSFELEEKTGMLKQQMSDALKPVRETAKASLSFLLNDTRNKIQQIMVLPSDGSAVPLTSDVMQRLQLMTAFLPPLSSIMRSLGDGGWTSTPNATASSSSSVPTLKSFDVGADGAQLFAHYCTDTLETLLSNLDSRARTLLKVKAAQGVFLANNVCIIERAIRASDLANLITAAAQPKLDVWKKKAQSAYTDGWKDCADQLLDVGYGAKGPRPTSTSSGVDSAAIIKALSSKDKDGIKEKFKNFNTSFDELVARHKNFKMEGEVRRDLGRAVQLFIERLYIRFWDRYREVDKGKGKYVKYDKAQVSQILAGLS